MTLRPGTRVRVIAYGESDPPSGFDAEWIGQIGTVIRTNDLYIYVAVDNEGPEHKNGYLPCVRSELEVFIGRPPA